MSKWNTHQTWNSLNRNIHIKMEHSSKWNTHQNGTLILSKWNSLNRNTHIITLWCTYNNLVTVQYFFRGRASQNPPSVAVACLACLLPWALVFFPFGFGKTTGRLKRCEDREDPEWNSPHQQALDP